jgi:hypothetical protein
MEIVVVVGVVLVVAFILMTVFSAENRRKRQLEGTPRTPIAHAAGGLTKVQGKLVHCWPPMQAPISGRPCAAYQVKVFTNERGTNGAMQEVMVVHEIKGQPFLLYDDTGRALISYDEQTAIILNQDVKATSGTLKDPTPLMMALLQRTNVDPTRIFGLNRAMRYEEGVLEQGELVTAHGIATREQDPDPAAAHAAGCQNPTVWTVLRAAPGIDLTVTDALPLDQRPLPPPGPPPQQQQQQQQPPR